MSDEEIDKGGSEPEDVSDPNIILPEDNLKKSDKEDDEDEDEQEGNKKHSEKENVRRMDVE